MFCYKCGKEIPDDSTFCKFCGTMTAVKLQEQKEEKQAENNVPEEKPSENKINKKLLIFAIVGTSVAVVAIIATIICVSTINRIRNWQAILNKEGFTNYSNTIHEDDNNSLETSDSYSQNDVDVRESGEISDSDFEKRGYLVRKDESEQIYYEILTNNSNSIVQVHSTAYAYNSDGNELDDADSFYEDEYLEYDPYILGPGDSAVFYYRFYYTDEIDHVETKNEYTIVSDYVPYTDKMQMEWNRNENMVDVLLTNTGDYIADKNRVYVIFYAADGSIVNVECRDNDNINPGVTHMVTVGVFLFDEYDHAEVYYSSLSTSKISDGTEYSLNDVSVTEQFEMSGNYFAEIHNSSSNSIYIAVYGLAYDPVGNLIGTSFVSCSNFDPGASFLVHSDFSEIENIDHVVFKWDIDEAIGKSYMSNLDFNYDFDQWNNMTIASIKNNNDFSVNYVTAYAFFFDDNDHLVGVGYRTFTADQVSNEIAPGALLSVELTCDSYFSYAKCYITGGMVLE